MPDRPSCKSPLTHPADEMPIDCRTYGTGPTMLVVLHGGPGAPGDLSPLAQRLGERYTVLEPLQRRSGGAPLTVARHVQDLELLLAERCSDARPIVLGHSWGAMLALAHGAAHPTRAAGLVLVSCGTFDKASRAELTARREAGLDADMRERMEAVQRDITDADERLAAMGCLFTEADGVDLIHKPTPLKGCDGRGNSETWADMIHCQESGLYPAAFSAIKAPVLMLHGEQDVHPGALTRAGLEPHLPQLQYVEWPRCGHSPWLERDVVEPFFATLHDWVAGHVVD